MHDCTITAGPERGMLREHASSERVEHHFEASIQMKGFPLMGDRTHVLPNGLRVRRIVNFSASASPRGGRRNSKTSKCEEFLPPPDISWSAQQLIYRLAKSLARCTSCEVVLSATGGRDRCVPFTEFPLLDCVRCGAVYDKVEEFLVHTLKQHFGEEHVKLYEELGLIHKDVQKVLDEARVKYYPVVGRALQNNQELCVLTPLSSPLAPFMLAGVTVSTREPSNKKVYTQKLIEGPSLERIPLYFSVTSVRRKHAERCEYVIDKKRKRAYREMKKCLKSFYIDAQDLLEHPPRDVEVARLLHEATGLPLGTSFIPARKIRLAVPIISSLDEVTSPSPSITSNSSTYLSSNIFSPECCEHCTSQMSM
ncbi:hypothetical protein Y032_0011g1271 [Ancylostoma ceylanicum]|nr:hypothetical protein Y032_0011g1271 [Ancylostoma ceylanicum]